MSPLLLSLSAALLVSLISLVGIVFVIFRNKSTTRLTLLVVAFAVGTLLGDAFLHLLPETFETIPHPLSSMLVILGILIFFLFEKVLRWHHCHDPECETDDKHHVVAVNLLGDTVHNFVDGMLIAATFMVDTKLGIATTAAIIFHEIPQEIGHFGVFLHHGMSFSSSLKFNFYSALASVAGVIFTFLIGQNVANFSAYLLPVTAGGFIYLAATDLIPELHEDNTKLAFNFFQVLFILIGVALMYSLLLLE